MIAAAAAARVPVALVTGQVSGTAPGTARVVTLAGLAGGTAAALAGSRRWLRQAGRQLAPGHRRGMPWTLIFPVRAA